VVADFPGNPALSGGWMRLAERDPDQCRRWTAADDTNMAFNSKQLWQLSILETAGVVTFLLSVLLIAGIVLVR
jgi:hypothetical protein